MTLFSKPLTGAMLRIVSYSTIIILVAEAIAWEARNSAIETVKFTESGLTELLQSLLLVATALLYLYAFLKGKEYKYIALLLFSFHFASLVREQSFVLDPFLFNGSWQLIVFTSFIIVVIQLARKRNAFVAEIRTYTASLPFGVLLPGLVTTYVFSRLYGRAVFWRAVMEDKYIRSVKNASEECIELLGYSILLIAAAEFVIRQEQMPHHRAGKGFGNIAVPDSPTQKHSA